MAGVSSSASSSSSSLRARVDELETELARVYDQLQEAEMHLTQAEAGIRDEVVGEIQVRCCFSTPCKQPQPQGRRLASSVLWAPIYFLSASSISRVQQFDLIKGT